MRTFTLKAFEKNLPEIEVDLTGEELNLIEVALLELQDNIQYEDADDVVGRHEAITKLLIKLGDM